MHMVISETIFQNEKKKITFRKTLIPKEMPKKDPSKSEKVVVLNSLLVRFVKKKTLTKKEVELHLYVCEKVPQEIFNESNIYFKTLLGGSSVSFGTNCNSSLTNPLLGALLLR